MSETPVLRDDYGRAIRVGRTQDGEFFVSVTDGLRSVMAVLSGERLAAFTGAVGRAAMPGQAAGTATETPGATVPGRQKESSMQQPTVGHIVHYWMHEGDAEQINRRRADFSEFGRLNRNIQPVSGTTGRTGHVGHFGNEVTAGDVYPAVVVRTFGDSGTVNLKVLLDGNDDYWATSRPEGDEPGSWSWPPRA